MSLDEDLKKKKKMGYLPKGADNYVFKSCVNSQGSEPHPIPQVPQVPQVCADAVPGTDAGEGAAASATFSSS